MNISRSFKFEPDDLVQGQQLHNPLSIAFPNSRRGFLIFGGSIILVLVFLIVTNLILVIPVYICVPAAALYGYLWFFIRILSPRQARKHLAQLKEYELPIRVEITSDEFRIEHQLGHRRRAWSDFLSWKENEKVFLLYVTDNSMEIIPKQHFTSEEVEQIRSVISANVAAAKGLSKSQIRFYIFIFAVIFLMIIVQLQFK